jgi:hypothetical protein
MRIKSRTTLLFLLTCFLTGACVQEVDFSGAFEKKVVVHCVIHNRIEDGDRPKQWSAYADPNLQTLWLYFSTPSGEKERIPTATARLYDNDTGMLLGEFDRVSDWEWKLRYEPAYETGGDTSRKYSLHLRLEITDIPGVENPITGITRLERSIHGNNVEYSNKPISGVGNNYCFSQRFPIATPAWFFPETVYSPFIFFTAPERGELNSRHDIKVTYPWVDSFNYTGGTYQYGLRILPDNFPMERFKLTLDDLSPLDPATRMADFASFILSYVSEEYDRYLQDAIVYRMRHDDESDPLKHLYEDQVYSNIDGGLGVFGVEVMAYYFIVVDEHLGLYI